MTADLLPVEDYLPLADADQLAREKHRARVLRSSAWWKRQRAAGRCYHCGGTFPPGELTMDHLIPLIRGGRSIKANVKPSCRGCNQSKAARLPIERAADLSQGGGK